MLEPIVEGKLRFDFPDPWEAVKFDDTRWYRETIKSRVKAVDIVAFSGDRHWWIEVKDCLGFETDNLPRLAAGEPDAVQTVRDWTESEGYKNFVSVKRAKPFIVDEVAEKLEGTLVSLAAARRAVHPEEIPEPVVQVLSAADVMAPEAKWTLVLLLTWKPEARDFSRLAMRLGDKLDKRLAAFRLDCFVLNENESAPAQPWSVTRITP